MNTKVKNNKILKITISIIVFILGLIFLNNKSYAATEVVNGITWTYTASSGKATNVYTSTAITTSLLTDGTTLVVPDTLGGYPVQSIGPNSTYNIIYKSNSASNANSTIKKIQLPTTVTTINQYAFSRLSGLTEIIGMDNVTTLGNYAFNYCSGLKTIQLPSNLKTINQYAFYYCTGLTSIEIPSKVTTIGNSAFRYCSALTSVKFNSNITSMGTYLFQNCTKLNTVDFNNYSMSLANYMFYGVSSLKTILNWDNITSIGTNVFYNCTGLTSLTLPSKLTSIGNYAFYGCSNISGDLIIPENVSSIGTYAFQNCSKLDGNIEFKTTKIVSIGNYTFYNCSNVKKVIIPSTVTSVGSNAFYGFKDVWVNANQAESKVSFASNFSGTNTAYVHYLDDLHTVEVQALPGIKIKDLNTGSDFVSGEFADGTNINLEFVVEEGYNYDNVKVLIEKDGTYKNNGKSYQELTLVSGVTYTDTNLLRNTKILTLNISNGLDLVARTYIEKINSKSLETSRETQFALENCVPQYKHTKYPLIVETGDTVVYKIRVYNEGNVAGTANKIVEYLPTGLDYYKDSKINSNYGWVLSEDGRTVTTEYTKDKNLSAYTGVTAPAYVELEIECIVSQEKGKDKIIRLTNFVEIAEASSEDVDSIPGNIVIQDSENYKKQDAENSNSGSYVKGEEDDQDFENVLVLRAVPVSYVLKISKVDSEDFKLLNGAKFDLINQNGETIQSGVTVQNGELVFDRITTYDGGMDVYYISEVETPVGYTNPLEQTIKITVIKTITDQLTESFALEIICDLLETRVDTTIDEDSLVPIYTKEQLKKVGSEEELEIKGITYKLGINNNYRLMENIDISGEEWIPLPNITGVFDGNEKIITGLTITNKNLKEIGLFSKFSGVIDSLTLDNIRISIDLSEELEELEERYEDDPEELEIQIENLISPYHIGGLVGSMTGGSIINTTVNGTITSDSNNLGGFVGYGENGYLTKIKNCTNNATVVTSHSNAGGFVGYSYSALSLVECTNNGRIIAEEYNAGGLVGYSEAKDYETSVVKTEFDSQNSIVNLIIGNNKYVGYYSLVLNKLDAGNKQLIDGTKFTVYDENKAVINGLEAVEVKNGVLNIGKIEVKTTGVDTYFLKEVEASKGYDKLQDFIRINVIKSWDGANSKFKFSTDSSNVTVDAFISSEFISREETPFSGAVYNYKQTDTVKWLVNKVVALSCINNGEIVAGVNASGIFAKTNCGVNIENSTNTAQIIAQNHTAGLLSEALKVDKETNVTINNSKNTGEIILNAGKYNYMSNAAGILADTSVYTIIKNSSNEGNVLGTASSVPTYAGIIANVQEDILIDNCKNKGQITSQGSTDIAAGILGKIIVEDSIANIKECENTGDITATTIAAGILGQAGGDEFIINDSSTNNCKIQATSVTGGIVGFSSTDAHISDCQTENLTLNANSGSTAAILALEVAANYSFGEVGNTYYYSSSPSLIDIKNISVKNMTLNGNPEDKGAIAGKIVISSNSALENVKFTDCTIEDSNIKTNVAGGYAGMIAGTIQGHHNLDILRCNINNSVIDQGYETNSGSSSNTGMMIGSLRIANNVGDSNINVLDSNIENCSIKLAGAGMVSNIIGYNYSSGKTVTTVKNTNIKSSPIDVKGTGDQKAGNIFGGMEQSKELIIDNCDIIDSPITTKTTGSYSEVAALVGHNFNNKFEFTNIDVENSSVASGAGTIGVLAADSYYGASSSGSVYEGKIENCNITNTTVDGQNHNSTYISGATNGGALMGMNRLGIITIKNVNLKSTKEEPDFVFATNAASTGIGYSGYALNVDNFNVDGYQYKAGTGNTQISGVVSILLNSLELRNSNLTNLKFDTTSNTATIVNYNSGNLIADNLNIKNIDMKNTQTGFISGFTNLVAGALKLSNSTIDNIEVESNGSGMHVAGLITHLNGNDNNISNCKISNIDVKANGTRHETASGIATIVNGSLVFADNEVSDIKVTGNGVNVSAIVASGRIDTVGTNSDSKTTLNNITLSSDYDSGVNMGTILGVSYDSNSKIQNVTANNVKLSTNSMAPRIGGLLGCAAGTVNNCKVMNSNIESTYSVYNQNNFPIVGGLYGLCSSSANNHSNLTVQNTTIKSNFGYVGGVYGLSQANVEKANVINCNVSALSSGATVGGIIGHDAYNLTISEAQVTDSKISNVGKAVSEISPNIITIYPTGGIVGFARGLVKDCDVIRTTVETTGTDSYATGGIVGHGFNASTTTHTVIQGCDVTDSTITGANGLGGIAGAAVAEITNCTVQGTETTSTNSVFAEKLESSVVIDDIASEEVKTEVTEEIKEEVTEEIKEEVIEEIKEEVTEEVKEEVTEEVKEEVAEEVKAEVTEEVKAEVIEEVRAEVTEEVKEEVTEEVKAEVTEEAKAEVTEEDKAEVTEEVKVEVTEEVKGEVIEEPITTEQVEEKIKTEPVLDAIISPIETIQPNVFVAELLAKENESKAKISGKNYIGGILGHGGVILDTFAQLTISNCTVKNTTIEGTTDVHEDVGVLPSYPATLVPTVELLNTIVDFVKENIILNILGE